ncbi:hypothetical protein ACFY7Z_10365 [Streptomyces sp. NPDC012623]|uniref:hypothetical protein n=1 Tax=unclassified Streptomyces TaxID=2593676 RepID=UPI0036AFBEB8
MTETPSKLILRRRSWPVMSWAGIITLWAVFMIALLAALAREDYANAWFFASVLSITSVLVRRIGSCRVTLHSDFLLTDNTIHSYRIPYENIRKVEMTSSGGIRIETFSKEEVRPFAFGGSILDSLFKTSEKAVAEINKRIPKRKNFPKNEKFSFDRKFRRSWPAESFLAISAITAAAGLITKII